MEETQSNTRYKTYYANNRQQVIDRVSAYKKARRQSTEHIEATRQQLLDDIANGKRSYIHSKTAKRYGLTRCLKTNKWVYQQPNNNIESSDDRGTYPEYPDLNTLMGSYRLDNLQGDARIQAQRVLLTYAQENKNSTNKTKQNFVKRILQTLGLHNLATHNR